MQYILMNKNKPLCKIAIDEENHYIINDIIEVYSDRIAFPIGIDIISGKPQKKSLAKWWAGRAIPGSRIGGHSFEQNYRIKLSALPFKNHGLSLSDQYWIKSVDEAIEWKDINFFDNDFSLEMGKALFDSSYVSADLDYMSPDSTSDGMLPKKWVRDKVNHKTYLLKAGSGPFEQEPFNELIVSKIANLLGVSSYVPYKISHEDGRYLCSCENFITRDTEFVTANSVRNVLSPLTTEHDNPYEFFLKCCESIGANIFSAKQSLDVMLIIDYIVANYDRHYGNFGFIRDANNYQILNVAPIFDTGSSLWNRSTISMIGKDFMAKAFCIDHNKNIELVTNFDLIDLNKLKDVDDLVKTILSKNKNLPIERIDLIANAVKQQVNKLQKIKDSIS